MSEHYEKTLAANALEYSIPTYRRGWKWLLAGKSFARPLRLYNTISPCRWATSYRPNKPRHSLPDGFPIVCREISQPRPGAPHPTSASQ